ncbi:MAG: sigma-70 factor domain-containing protein, partial [Bacilli bacterium]
MAKKKENVEVTEKEVKKIKSAKVTTKTEKSKKNDVEVKKATKAKAKETKKAKKAIDEEEEDPIVIVDEDEEIESLETIKKRIIKTFKERGFIDMSEVLDETSHLDLSDQDVEDLIVFFKSKGVDVISDIDAEAEIDDVPAEEIAKAASLTDDDLIDDDADEEDEEEKVEVIDDLSKIATGEVKVNDSVKMYLKEIGRVDLLR